MGRANRLDICFVALSVLLLALGDVDEVPKRNDEGDISELRLLNVSDNLPQALK